jgi:poly(3-hydroxybutyrate) depolymerase/peptidoglycan/LPS O-acetylase OafA/YrhL
VSADAAAAAPGAAAAGNRSRPHILAFDLVRLLIIAFVVGVHTLSNGGGTVNGLLGAVITVFHTSRELFFLLTAFVLVYNYGKRPRIKWLSFWRRRYKLVIPAYLAWTAIYFFADGTSLHPLHQAVARFWYDLHTGNSRYHMYFLLVTMQLYLLFPLVRWLLRKTEGHHRALFAVVLVYQLLLTFAVHDNWSAPGIVGSWLHNPTLWLPSYALYVIGGGIAAWHFDQLAAFTRHHLRAAGLVAAGGLGAGIGTYCVELLLGQTPDVASGVFQPVLVVETLAYAWGLLAAGLWWTEAGAPGRRLAAAGADCSFGIYLAHPLVLQGLLLAGQDTGALAAVRHAPEVVELLALLACVPVVYGVSWGLIFLLRWTPLSLVLAGRSQRSQRSQVKRTAPAGARVVLGGSTLLCALILGAGLWAAHGAGASASASASVATWPTAEKVSSSTQKYGAVTLDQTMYKIEVDGQLREWVQLTPPDGLTGSAPVLIVLSGIDATTSVEITRDHLTGYDAELVYPVSLYKSWNAGGCCGKAAKYDVNDVAFMDALVAAVDPGHTRPVTLVGYSNGGRLTYRIACTDPGLVDSYVVVKADPEPGCVVSKPVTIMQVAARNDYSVPYQPGDKGKESPPATVQVARLRSADGATGAATVLTRGGLTVSTWHGKDGTSVEFAVYSSGKHSFPQASGNTPSGAAVIWAFVTGGLSGPAEDQGIAGAGQVHQALAGPGGDRGEGGPGALRAGDAALGQEDLLRAQAALAVLEVDQRQQALPLGGRARAVPGEVAADDLAQLGGDHRTGHGADSAGVQIGNQRDGFLAVEPARQAVAQRMELISGERDLDLYVGDPGDLLDQVDEQRRRQRRRRQRGVLHHDRDVDGIGHPLEVLNDLRWRHGQRRAEERRHHHHHRRAHVLGGAAALGGDPGAVVAGGDDHRQPARRVLKGHPRRGLPLSVGQRELLGVVGQHAHPVNLGVHQVVEHTYGSGQVEGLIVMENRGQDWYDPGQRCCHRGGFPSVSGEALKRGGPPLGRSGDPCGDSSELNLVWPNGECGEGAGAR